MKILKYLILLAGIVSFWGCEKTETFHNTDTQVGHSKVIFFPTVAIQGDRLIVLKQGDTYTEPGVTATLNNQPTQFTTEGTVNTATPGVYEVTYTAKNEEGFSASDWRTVVVIGNDVANNDFSGTYMRYVGGDPFGVTSTWKKIGNGLYEVDNPGGAGVGVGFKVIVANYQGNKIKMPRQIAFDPSSGNKEVSSTNETYSTEANPVQYTWVFLAGGYGTSLRTFKKQ